MVDKQSKCICVEGCHPPNAPRQYPEWTEGEDNVKRFRKNGYMVVRGLYTQREVDEAIGEISATIKTWFEKLSNNPKEGNDWEEVVNRLPELQGKPADVADAELSVRKLFRMAVHTEYFARISRHPKTVAIMTQLLGADIKLVQSMALLKPPGSGEKKWHQDNAYFRLSPANLVGCWIALDFTNCSNGCMHVLPSSHGSGVYKHASPNETHIDYSMVELPQPDDVVPVVLNPGDALLFHGETAHYTPPNVTSTRRRSLQFHYAASGCKPIKCPRLKPEDLSSLGPPASEDKPHYFDCDPNCAEPEYWYYKKAEILVCGQDYGGDFI